MIFPVAAFSAVSCPTGYTERNDGRCKIDCAAGTLVSTYNGPCVTATNEGEWYTGAHTILAGQRSAVNYCAGDYKLTNNSSDPSDHDSYTDCVKDVPGGEQITTGTTGVRYIRYSNQGNTVSASTVVTEIEAFASHDGTGANLLAGIIPNGAMTHPTWATDGNWARNNWTNCTATNCAFTFDMGSVRQLGSIAYGVRVGEERIYYGLKIEISADGVTWIVARPARNFDSQKGDNPIYAARHLLAIGGTMSQCEPGYARTAHTLAIGETSTCGQCTGWEYADKPGMSECTDCPSPRPEQAAGWHYWYDIDGDGLHANIIECAVEVPWNTVQEPGTVHGSATSICRWFSGTDGNAQYGSIVANGEAHKALVAGFCDGVYKDRVKCDAGYFSRAYMNPGTWYSQVTSCIPVGPGYWSVADDPWRNECTNAPTGAHYTNSLAASASECTWACNDGYALSGEQCLQLCRHPGLQTLHVGNLSIPLYQAKNTEHVLAVQYNGDVCYAGMATGTKAGALNIDIAGAVWHTVE